MYRNVDAELKRKGMTRGDLAKKLKSAPSTLSLKFSGKSSITLDEAKRIKEILEVDIPLEILFEQTRKTA